MAELSDMLIHWGKTKAMHAQQTIEVAKPKPAEYQEKEAKALRKSKCEGCDETVKLCQRGWPARPPTEL
jgi:hypothetical protein